MRTKDSTSFFARTASHNAQKEIDMKAEKKALIKEMTSSKEKAISYLKKAGICNDKGELSKIYR